MKAAGRAREMMMTGKTRDGAASRIACAAHPIVTIDYELVSNFVATLAIHYLLGVVGKHDTSMSLAIHRSSIGYCRA